MPPCYLHGGDRRHPPNAAVLPADARRDVPLSTTLHPFLDARETGAVVEDRGVGGGA
jgi:hypothetical protein